MAKIKRNAEYTETLRRGFWENFKQRNFKEGIKLYNAYFHPDNLAHKIFYKDKETGYIITYEQASTGYERYREYYKKLWKGEDLTDKTIFLFFYICGQGDLVMYSRYIRLLEKMGAEVVIEPSNNLFELFKYNFQNCKVVPFTDSKTDIKYDYTLHYEHLINLQDNLETFPYSEGYLKADPELVKKYAPIFNTDKLKVGVFNEGRQEVDERFFGINKLAPIFRNQQCQFYSLNRNKSTQYGNEFHNVYNIIELQRYINNANDTAALMKNLDLIITVDSFPVHLAGALGIKTYLLITHDSDWRWFDNYYKTEWYDSVRIIRKTPYNTYKEQIEELAQCLRQDCMEYYSKMVTH